MSITVLDIARVSAEGDGDVAAKRFLNAHTVGASVVEGIAYELAPGSVLPSLEDASRHQLFYVTAGNPTAVYEERRHELGPGRGVYCEPGESCAFENPGDAPASIYRFLVTQR